MAQNFPVFKGFDIIHPDIMLPRSGIVLVLVCLVLCLAGVGAAGEAGRPSVVTSIFPLMDFARAVAGDRAEVSLLLPPGAEVHTWQPSARQVLGLDRADLFIYVGRHLEPWADDAARSRRLAGRGVLEVSEGTPLIGNDPHIWLDLGLDVAIVERIAEALSRVDPGGAEVYRRNAGAYSVELRRLDEKFRATLGTCAEKTLVVGGHAAFGYLAARYGLTQVALYGLSPDSEPTPRRLIEITREVKERKIGAVFFESAVNPRLAMLLAKETGAQALPLSDGANLSPEQARRGVTFLEVLEEDLASLNHGLHCR